MHGQALARGEIGVDVVLEVVRQHGVFRRTELVQVRQHDRVDDDRALCLHRGDRGGEDAVGVRLLAAKFAHHADALATQAVGVEVAGVVGGVRVRIRAGRVARITAGHRRQQDGGIGHVARHGAGRILVVADGHDAAATDQAECRLDSDDPVHCRRTDDRAVRLRADGHRAEAGRNRYCRARARAARIAVEHVGVVGLSAAAAPAAAGMAGAVVCPFAEVGLAQDQRAGLAQARHHAGIARCRRAGQRQRAGRGQHAVTGVDVVLQQHGDAIQQPRGRLLGAFRVQYVRQGQGLGVGLDDGMQRGAMPIQPVDAPEQLLGQLMAGEYARMQARLQLTDRGIGQGRRRFGRSRMCAGGEQHADDRAEAGAGKVHIDLHAGLAEGP